MVRVRLLTELSFGSGGAQTGAELELPDAQAEALVDLGLVERIPPEPVPPEPGAIEATTLESDETATLPRPSRRPR